MWANRPERIGQALLCPDGCGHRVDQHQEGPGEDLGFGCMLCPCTSERGAFADHEDAHVESIQAAQLAAIESEPDPAPRLNPNPFRMTRDADPLPASPTPEPTPDAPSRPGGFTLRSDPRS